jgi:hypothetical protein
MKPELSPQRHGEHGGSFSEANAPNMVDVQVRSFQGSLRLCELCGSVVKLVMKDPQITQITQISRNQ